jgi:hypothetical protein
VREARLARSVRGNLRESGRCTLLPAQTEFYNHIIRAIDVTTGTVRTLAGRLGVVSPFSDGVGSAATFAGPHGVALDSSGTLALVVSKNTEFFFGRLLGTISSLNVV